MALLLARPTHFAQTETDERLFLLGDAESRLIAILFAINFHFSMARRNNRQSRSRNDQWNSQKNGEWNGDE